MASRYFVEQLEAAAEVELEGNEAHHLLHVVRLRPGERVLLFDGKGTDADAVIVATSRRKVELRVEELRRHLPEASGLTLAVAPPKGERLRWMVEKLTELGVSRWVPLLTERGVVSPGEGRQSKMPQWVIEAARQCGRHHLM
ncbi:MAG: 16S rRNA (uracil(1498)-N(3))-methyltransferase, partial [Planctomycetaceae bacterium]|nr:16S rRNA (uracil(1498)-N(3))-methyltransferase [Planctomycetaceae bacterium]